MCGIVGFTGHQNDTLLFEMNNLLKHRGPDEDGFYTSENISLAMRRLSIVDLENGKQPYTSLDKSITVVFNGEIYNYKELRQLLEKDGFTFRSHHSDGEIIPNLYLKYGLKFINKINGMFAIALYDKKINKLFLFRDRIGEKPLYYMKNHKEFYFASEIKSLTIINKQINIDKLSLINYLQLKNTSAPDTIYKEIKQLLAGHYIEYDLLTKKQEEKAYWKIDFSQKSNLSESEICDELEYLLEDSIKLRIDCDVDYGTFLSGGLDSSLLTSMIMKKNIHNNLKTFSLGYKDDFKNKQNDFYYAQKLSKMLGTEHHNYILDSNEVFQDLTNVLKAFDEPFSGTISTYFLTKLISKHVKVAVSGDGADELFGSYLTHRMSIPMNYFLNLNKPNFNDLTKIEKNKIAPFNTEKEFNFLKSFADKDITKWRNKLNVFTNTELSSLLNDTPSIHINPYSKIDITATGMLDKCLEIDQKELLQNQILPFVDRLSMKHSVEVRVPFLDYRIIELAAKLPQDLKINTNINKYILKKTAEKHLPKDIIYRPKEGFVLPVYNWIEDKYFNLVKETILDSFLIKDFNFNHQYIESLLDNFSLNKKDHAKIWNLYSLAVWYKGIK